MSPFQMAILEIIKVNDRKFSWYQIDRALSQRASNQENGRFAPGRLMSALRELEQMGYIMTTPGHHPAQPLYTITPTGQQALEAQQPRGLVDGMMHSLLPEMGDLATTSRHPG